MKSPHSRSFESHRSQLLIGNNRSSSEIWFLLLSEPLPLDIRSEERPLAIVLEPSNIHPLICAETVGSTRSIPTFRGTGAKRNDLEFPSWMIVPLHLEIGFLLSSLWTPLVEEMSVQMKPVDWTNATQGCRRLKVTHLSSNLLAFLQERRDNVVAGVEVDG